MLKLFYPLKHNYGWKLCNIW